MSEPKNHHYVPQHHLRRFAESETHIRAYHFGNREEYRVPIDNICSEKDFWSRELEKNLNDVETNFAEVNHKIENAGTLEVLDQDDYFTLLLFALFQRLRTKSQKQAIDEMVQKSFKWYAEAGYESGELDEETYESIKNGELRIAEHPMFEQLLLQAPLSVPMVWDLNPILIQNNSDKEFVIGENPVIFDNFRFKYVEDRFTNGLCNKGLVIILPLSKNQYLIFYDPQTYYVDSDNSLKVEIEDKSIVRSLNIYQMVWSEEFVFFREQGRQIEMRSSQDVFGNFMENQFASTNKYQYRRNKNELIEFSNESPEITPFLPFLKEKENVEHEIERIEGMREKNNKFSRQFLKEEIDLDEEEIKEVLPERDD